MPRLTGLNPLGGLRRRATHPPSPLLPDTFRPAAGYVAGACAIATALLGVLVAHQTNAGWLDDSPDRAIHSSLGSHTLLLNAVADLGDPRSVIVGTVCVFLVCVRMRRFRGAVLVTLAVLAASLAEYLLKPLVDRTLSGSQSYPSGHTAGAFALAVAVSVLLIGPLQHPLRASARRLLAAVILALACAVAVAQVARGKHYLTDTLGGAALAISVVLLTALAVDALADRLRRRRSLRMSALTDE